MVKLRRGGQVVAKPDHAGLGHGNRRPKHASDRTAPEPYIACRGYRSTSDTWSSMEASGLRGHHGTQAPRQHVSPVALAWPQDRPNVTFRGSGELGNPTVVLRGRRITKWLVLIGRAVPLRDPVFPPHALQRNLAGVPVATGPI